MHYLALVGKSPDSSCHFNGKYDKQEEEELHSGKIELRLADALTTCTLFARRMAGSEDKSRQFCVVKPNSHKLRLLRDLVQED